MMPLVHEALVLAMLLVAPLVGALLVAGVISTVMTWWWGSVDQGLASAIRWGLMLVALVVIARWGGPPTLAYAHKVFAWGGAAARQAPDLAPASQPLAPASHALEAR